MYMVHQIYVVLYYLIIICNTEHNAQQIVVILYALMNNCVVHEIVVLVLYGLICNTEHYNVQRIIMILYGLVCISVYNYDYYSRFL